MRLVQSGHPGPVNIGNPQEISMTGLAETIRDLTGSRSPISYVPRPVDDPSVRQPDTTLAREALGWQPAVGLEEGLRRTIDYFRAVRARESSAPQRHLDP
jgi:dTDP-glucose 4,6-dehydratase